MEIINYAVAGDHKGQIKFKNMKKGLYIDESKMFRKSLCFINKSTVESYELLTSESEQSKKGSLSKGVVGGAVFGIAGAIAGGTSSKTKAKYTVSIVFTDGTKALCELDSQYYNVLLRLLY